VTTSHRAIPLCDVHLVNGYHHRLGEGYWRVTTPDNRIYRCCSLGCLVTLICESGGIWGEPSQASFPAIGYARDATASGVVG